MGGNVSYPRNRGWKDLSNPKKELTVSEIKTMLEKKEARSGKINKKSRPNNSTETKNVR